MTRTAIDVVATDLVRRLRELKNRYSNNPGFSSPFVAGYQQGLAEARDVVTEHLPPAVQVLEAKVAELRALANAALVQGGQQAGTPQFAPSTAKLILEILDATPVEDDTALTQDGYPTEATLTRISTWPPHDAYGMHAFLRLVWTYKNYISVMPAEDGTWEASTGGWSGNEDLIQALTENSSWWTFNWYSSRRGGHYVFRAQEK